MDLRRLLVVFGLFLAFASSCKRTEREDAMLDRLRDGGPQKEAFNVRFLFSEQGILQAELTAPHAIEAKENDLDVRIFDRGLEIAFYNPEGDVKSELRAGKGTFKNNFNYAELLDDVVVVNNKSDTLMTDTLYWDKTINLMHTKRGRNIIRTPNEEITGDSISSTTNFSEYKIYNITGVVRINQGEGI
jgi:LPS export ABC transporter protein LptC